MRILSLDVYRATPAAVLAGPEARPLTPDLELLDLDGRRAADLVETGPHAERFPAFVAAGYRGLLLAQGNDWLSVGWLATPMSPPAIHLPQWAGGRFWIFNCRTRSEHRGHGHYQRILVGLVDLASRLGDEERDQVFIDTESSNAPSIRAIERVGFSRAGRIYQLEISRLGLRPTLPIGVPDGRPALPR